jgi:hypothetical protein
MTGGTGQGDRMKECDGPVEKAVELRRLTTCLDNY